MTTIGGRALSAAGGFGWLTALLSIALLAGCGGGSGRYTGTDIVVTGVGPAGQVAGGAAVSFVMTVANTGDSAANALRVTDSLGGQMAFNGITCVATGGAVCPAELGAAMNVDTLPAGASLVFTVDATVVANGSGTINNTMAATFDDDVDRTNNTATASGTAYTNASNVVVTGSGPSGAVTGGAVADFQMVVRNDGPDVASGLHIVDSIGSNLTLVGITCTASAGATCPTPGVVMDVDRLAVGASLTFTVSVRVAQGVNGTVVNSLSVTVDSDTQRSDNAAVATAAVVTAQAGVFATGVGPAAAVAGGDTALFTMTVSNAGPDAATGVRIVDTVGGNLTFTAITCTPSGGAICPAVLGPVMDVGGLPAGGALVFGVTARVAATTNGAITNTLAVTADNDFDRADNSATAVGAAATPRATLTVAGIGPAAAVAGGDVATFVTTVGNSGPDTATGVRVLNTVGANLSFVGATCSAAGGAVCPATVGVVTDVGNLPVGGLLTFNVRAAVAVGTNGAITDTVQATAANDASPGGNTAVAVGQAFTARSSLTLTGSGPANVPAGGSANFAMTLTNAGPQAAAAVRLIDAVGGNLTLTSIGCTAAGGAVCPAVTGPTMEVVDLPVGGSLVFNVAATVAVGTQGTIVNTLTATLTSGTPTEVVAVAVGSAYSNNVAVAVGGSGQLSGGDAATFVASVSNSGPGPALNVAITTALSANLSPAGPITCAAIGGAMCPAAPGPSMVAPSIPANGVLNFSVPVVVNAGTNGSVTATVTAFAAGDTRPADNTASAAFSAVSTDLGVTQSGAPTAAAGGTATFTALVVNPGPATATNLVLSQNVSGPGAAGGSVAVACSASAGAACPATLGGSMTVPSLGVGRTLAFTVTVTVPAAARGAIVSGFGVSADGDPNASNNQTSVTTTAIDPRNGNYVAVAADGREYDLGVDFDALSYVLAGNGTTVQRSFMPGASGNEYVVAGNARLRTAPDLIVGSHDFGAGPQPFVAARSFTASVAGAAGSYDLATLTLPGAGGRTSLPGTARIQGNVLQVCEVPQSVSAVQNCPAASLRSYELTVAGTVYTGTEPATGDVYAFRIANTGASSVLMSAGPVGTANAASRQLRIGVPDAAALAGGTLRGPSTTGDWVQLTLGATSYAYTGALGADSAALQRASAGAAGPFSLLTGARASDGAPIYVMQSSPLAIAVGGFGSNASGLLQLGLP